MALNTKALHISIKIFLRVVVAGLLLPANMGFAMDHIVIGKAYNLKGELEYIEHHTVRYKNDQIVGITTIFLDAEFKKIGDLISDFSKGSQYGSYKLTDIRQQYSDGARVETDRITLFHRKNPKAALKTKTLPLDSRQIVGQGFNQFIVANVDALIRGEELRMKLVLPSKLDQYDVCIRKTKTEGNILHIRVEMENWFLKLFAPHLDAEYDLRLKRLLRYDGISMIADSKGKNAQVSISYEYEPDKTLLAKLPKF
ncbi:MAG: hypothetical protein PVG08_22485 [Desulfobacterales bacterium]|jgi:hypothetical protein